MKPEDITYTASDRVATITLNRPQRFNSISERLSKELAFAVQQAENDDAVHGRHYGLYCLV